MLKTFWNQLRWKSKVSLLIILSFFVTQIAGPAALNLQAYNAIASVIQKQQAIVANQIVEFFTPEVAYAQDSTVPKPVITPPSDVSNSVPLVKGLRLVNSQDKIIFCRAPEPCPSGGEVVADEDDFFFYVSLAPLVDGKNDFIFLAQKGTQLSEPVGFSVYYQSEASAAQDIVPPGLDDCIAQAGKTDSLSSSSYGYPTSQPYRGVYIGQIRDSFSTLPDDGRGFGGFSAFDREDDRTSRGEASGADERDDLGSINPEQGTTASTSSTTTGTTVGSERGNITRPSGFLGGEASTDRLAAVNTAESKLLGGSRQYRYCVEQIHGKVDLRGQNLVAPGNPGAGDINNLIGRLETGGIGLAGGSDRNGFFDDDGNFVPFGQASGSGTDAFAEVGRDFTLPPDQGGFPECDPTVLGTCGDEFGDDFEEEPLEEEELEEGDDDDDEGCGMICAIIGTAFIVGAGAQLAAAALSATIAVTTIGAVLLPLFLILGVILLILAFTCPSYYIDIAGTESYITNGLLTQTNQAREARDVLAIDTDTQEHLRHFTLVVKEHIKEILFLNTLGIQSVIHDTGASALVDQNNNFQTIQNPTQVTGNLSTHYSPSTFLEYSSRLAALQNHINRLRVQLPLMEQNFEALALPLIGAASRKDVREFQVPSELLSRNGALKVVVQGTVGPTLKKHRFGIQKKLPESEIDTFYDWMNSCTECSQFMSDTIDEFFAIRLETLTSNGWKQVSGKLILEGNQTKIFTVPENMIGNKFRIVTVKDGYIFSQFAVERSENNVLDSMKLQASSVEVQSTNPNLEARRKLLRDDDQYVIIEKDDEIRADFNIESVWERKAQLEKKFGRELGISFFIDNKGYYEVGRSLTGKDSDSNNLLEELWNDVKSRNNL